MSSGMTSIVGAMLNAGKQSRKKSRTREVLGENGGWMRSRRAEVLPPIYRPREALRP
jgi:hypothetical protein